MTESLKGRETEVDRWKDGETHWNKQAIGLHEEKKKKILYYIILYYIIILWDHRRICGPSLTEMSLCGAYVYLILSLYILPRPIIISQPSASIRPDFTIAYCNEDCKLVGSHRVKPYGESIRIACYRILKYRVDGPMMVRNDGNLNM